MSEFWERQFDSMAERLAKQCGLEVTKAICRKRWKNFLKNNKYLIVLDTDRKAGTAIVEGNYLRVGKKNLKKYFLFI